MESADGWMAFATALLERWDVWQEESYNLPSNGGAGITQKPRGKEGEFKLE